MRRAATLLLAMALAPALLPAAVSAQEPQASLPDLEDEVMCLTCGTTLALSNSPQAQRERDYINVLISEGRTKDEIKDALVDQYGSDVLATPGTEGFDLVAWLLPIAAMLAVGGVLIVGVRHWRAAGATRDAVGPSPESASPGADAERLRADLERYEL